MASLLDDLTNADIALLKPRARILQTAHRLFYSDGIRATGVDRLIAESAVTKTTFYRQFSSKHELILAFLHDRHEKWMAWFEDGLERHGGGTLAIVPTLKEWLESPQYRGCAFINSVGELGSSHPEVMQITRRHKHDMTSAIEHTLPMGRVRRRIADAISLAVDGTIIRAQMGDTAKEALAPLRRIIKSEVAQLHTI